MPTDPARSSAPAAASTPQPPSLDVIARAWHELSDEPTAGIALDGPGCGCRPYARQARELLHLLHGPPPPEPEGLGAVVINPFTGGIWVRAAHPALPRHDPTTASPQEWADPTTEDWFTYDQLPQPLVQQNPGWTPPPTNRDHP